MPIYVKEVNRTEPSLSTSIPWSWLLSVLMSGNWGLTLFLELFDQIKVSVEVSIDRSILVGHSETQHNDTQHNYIQGPML
jgi:hypothetical protein